LDRLKITVAPGVLGLAPPLVVRISIPHHWTIDGLLLVEYTNVFVLAKGLASCVEKVGRFALHPYKLVFEPFLFA
jgi:hypothetical protein